MKDTIYLVLTAYGEQGGYYPNLSAGYFSSEKEAQEYCKQQAAQDYEDWKRETWRVYHRSLEDYLYPELLRQDDESKLLLSLFGMSSMPKPQVPDTSEESYRERAVNVTYRVQEIKPHETILSESTNE